VTFEVQGNATRVSYSEVYPTKEALEEAMQGSAAALPEQLEQLDELLSSISE
jgi:biopolymer transport protein ExbB/TolQ